MTAHVRLALALLLPFIACGVQWLLWDAWIKPYVWFLFFPVAYFSAWLGGLRAGIASTLMSAFLVWYVFMPPQYSLELERSSGSFSIVVFIFMGFLFARLHDKLQRLLHSSEGRYEGTFEQAAVGMALVAPDGRFLRVNRKLCAILGYTPAELMAKTFHDITYPADLDADLEFVKRVLAREIETFSMEKRYFRKDGSLLWIQLTASVVWHADNTPDHFIAIIEDIAARKQAEQRFQLLFEQAPIALSSSNRDGRIMLMNQAFIELFGYTIDDTPTVVQWRDRVMADARQRTAAEHDWDERWRDASPLAPFTASVEHTARCRDGSLKTVMLSRLRLGDEMLLAAVDITARKATEEEIMRRNQELERFDRAAVGREIEMIRLKREVNALMAERGRPAPYDLGFAESADFSGQAS